MELEGRERVKFLKSIGFEEDGGCYRKFYGPLMVKRISVYGNNAYPEHLYSKKGVWGWYNLVTRDPAMLKDVAEFLSNGFTVPRAQNE